MPAEMGYKVGIVIVDQHEPEGETATRLLEIAEDKGYSPRVVEAQRGEHDAGLSFRAPEDVVDAFNSERRDLWPDDSAKRAELYQQRVDGSVGEDPKGKSSKIENNTEKPADQATTDRTTEKAANQDAVTDETTTSTRKARTDKAPKE